MNFDLTEEQKLIQDTARDFAIAELEPVAAELDDGGDKEIFYENLRKLGELGFMGLNIGMNMVVQKLVLLPSALP